MFFTIHNTLTEIVPFTLTVDAAALGIAEPSALAVTELVSADTVPYEVQDNLLLMQGELAPPDTVVFRLQEEPTPTPAPTSTPTATPTCTPSATQPSLFLPLIEKG